MVIATITSISVYASATNTFVADDEGLITPGELIYESESVTNEDMKTHFENYADDSATLDLPNTITDDEHGIANVVGIVKDIDTGSVISGATVSVNGMIAVTTGSDGRFQIKNLPAGTYDWIVTADGYKAAEYLNYEAYDLSSGATIFTFDLSKVQPINDNWLNTTTYDEHV